MKVKLRLLCSDAGMSAPLLGPGTLQLYVKPMVTNLGVKLGCRTFPDLRLLAYYMSCHAVFWCFHNTLSNLKNFRNKIRYVTYIKA